MVFNESKSRTVRGDLLIRLKDKSDRVYRYDAMSNKVYEVEQIMASGFDTPVMISTVTLEPYESTVLFTAGRKEAEEWLKNAISGSGSKKPEENGFESLREMVFRRGAEDNVTILLFEIGNAAE